MFHHLNVKWLECESRFFLLHDQRFSGWRLSDFVFSRYHFTKDYAKRTAKKGNDVVLYTFHQEVKEAKEYVMDGYKIRVLPVSFRFPPFVPIGNSHNFQIMEELNIGDFDIVHFHNYYFWSLAPVMLAKKAQKWRLIAQYHGEPELQVVGKYIHRFLFCNIDRFLAPFNEEIYWLKRMRVKPERIVKFPNVGVDTSKYARVGEKEDVPHLIYVGRMTLKPRTLKEKNPWLIVNIASKLKKHVDDFKIIMVGDGPGLSELKEFAVKMGVNGNIEFAGYKPHDMLPSLYSKCLLSFVPLSMWDLDPFWDGSLKESLACETAVAGFNAYIKSYEEARRRFGLLLPTDVDKAAEFLSRAIKDRDFLIEAGLRGRSFIEEHCSWDKVINRLLEIYQSLLLGL
jgi:glycosyltransferase involved in cell wall biosynthesis